MDRIASVNRTTKETSISLKINLDGKGISNIKTPVGFLNHMLTLFSFHSSIDIDLFADEFGITSEQLNQIDGINAKVEKRIK